MNYLRPNIKRGNMSDQEEDLIIRLHKLLGNRYFFFSLVVVVGENRRDKGLNLNGTVWWCRWSLIAARLPGRTDNEIKNYWNYHLRKKRLEERVLVAGISSEEMGSKSDEQSGEEKGTSVSSKAEENSEDSEAKLDDFDDFFDFSNENPSTLEWVTKFLEFSSNGSC